MWTSFERVTFSVKCQAINSLDDAVGLLRGREKDVIVVYLLEMHSERQIGRGQQVRLQRDFLSLPLSVDHVSWEMEPCRLGEGC